MMRILNILTWNCNGALRKKFDTISEFNADIYIIQECEDPERTSDKKYKEWAKNYLWTGDNTHKGLGVFAKENVKTENLCWETNGLKYFIPCRINNSFNLLATWCHGANSPTFGYIGQFWKYLQINKAKLENSIIAGDFNSNVIWDRWDRWWNHSDVVRELAELKIESLYHKFYSEEQGKESQPTFYLQKRIEKPYHIDYIFGSEEFSKSIKSLTIGKTEQWLKLSDHMPVIVEIELANNMDT
jgi:exonuclease III